MYKKINICSHDTCILRSSFPLLTTLLLKITLFDFYDFVALPTNKAIFPVKCSDQLVRDLRFINEDEKDIIRYTRFDQDPLQQGLKGTSPLLRGHMAGMIMASKDEEVYEWLLSLASSKVS